MDETLTHNQPVFSISEISGALKRTVEEAFGHVRVRGEVSGFKRAASGHLYLDLKDERAVLRSVCWKGTASTLPFEPEDGLEVIATGRLSTYAARSNYQLVIESMEIAGEGALMALLEKRKKALAAEGLFAEELKKPLPFLPRNIAVVTSPTGAVIRDILHRLADRFPVNVALWPVRVQGEGAAKEVAQAIDGVHLLEPKPDLIIVARGGGSLEDLWAFNEEAVVRAVARAEIPVISAVGHETDTTLCDYAADRRAPTPTGAAEMAVPVLNDLRYALMEDEKRLFAGINRFYADRKERLSHVMRGLIHPRQLLEQHLQKIDDMQERLLSGLRRNVSMKTEKLHMLTVSMRWQSLHDNMAQSGLKLQEWAMRSRREVENRLAQLQERLSHWGVLLDAIDHRAILARGFALVWDARGGLVTSAGHIKPGAEYIAEFKDGRAAVMGSGVTEKGISNRARNKKQVKPSKGNGDQGSLF